MMIITINTEGSLVTEVQYDSWPNLTEFCSFLFLFVRSNMLHRFLLSPLWIHLEALLCVQAAKSNFDHPDLLPYGNLISNTQSLYLDLREFFRDQTSAQQILTC